MKTRYIVTCADDAESITKAWANTMLMAMRQKQMLERLTGKPWHIRKQKIAKHDT